MCLIRPRISLGTVQRLDEVAGQAEHANFLPRIVAVMSGTAKCVLIVEDSPDDLRLLGRQLRQFQIEQIAFSTGTAALEYLFDPSNPLPAAILLDLILPQMHGFDVLREVRRTERTKELPVIIVTSSAQEKDALKYYRVGINGFLVKPVQAGELRETLVPLGIESKENGGGFGGSSAVAA